MGIDSCCHVAIRGTEAFGALALDLILKSKCFLLISFIQFRVRSAKYLLEAVLKFILKDYLN